MVARQVRVETMLLVFQGQQLSSAYVPRDLPGSTVKPSLVRVGQSCLQRQRRVLKNEKVLGTSLSHKIL